MCFIWKQKWENFKKHCASAMQGFQVFNIKLRQNKDCYCNQIWASVLKNNDNWTIIDFLQCDQIMDLQTSFSARLLYKILQFPRSRLFREGGKLML
jgi:hypothetical protein